MNWLEILYFVLVLIISMVGLAGVFLPVIPGILVIFLSVLLYAILTGFETISVNLIIIYGVLTGLTYLLDYLAAVFGVKKMGGSFAGMAGAFVGLIIGLIFPVLGIFTFLIGSFLGAFVFEMAVKKESRIALKAGLGSFIGFLIGGVLKFAVGVGMIGIFIWIVLFK